MPHPSTGSIGATGWLPGTGHFVPHDDRARYLFAGVDGRRVERNAFIEGTDQDPPTGVDAKAWVGDAQAGIVMTRRNCRLA